MREFFTKLLGKLVRITLADSDDVAEGVVVYVVSSGCTLQLANQMTRFIPYTEIATVEEM